jgi:hypothetical protein
MHEKNAKTPQARRSEFWRRESLLDFFIFARGGSV